MWRNIIEEDLQMTSSSDEEDKGKISGMDVDKQLLKRKRDQDSSYTSTSTMSSYDSQSDLECNSHGIDSKVEENILQADKGILETENGAANLLMEDKEGKGNK